MVGGGGLVRGVSERDQQQRTAFNQRFDVGLPGHHEARLILQCSKNAYRSATATGKTRSSWFQAYFAVQAAETNFSGAANTDDECVKKKRIVLGVRGKIFLQRTQLHERDCWICNGGWSLPIARVVTATICAT